MFNFSLLPKYSEQKLPPKIKDNEKFVTLKQTYFQVRVNRCGLLDSFCQIASILCRYVALFLGHRHFRKQLNKYRVYDPNTRNTYLNIYGIKLPDISKDKEKINFLKFAFNDSFLVPCFYNDNHSKNIVETLDQYMGEGPYGYTDEGFDVTVKPGDTVIDAGAWIGDFSAYAANKGAKVYAFEPVAETFAWLKKTAELNPTITPVASGLGNQNCTLPIYVNSGNSGNNSIVTSNKERARTTTETITITTLDDFVQENNLQKIDFIKSDIEGAERDLLKGATFVLKKFAPKLAICTYHLPDDPQVLEKIILDANPKYKVVHLRHKLFACVPNQ